MASRQEEKERRRREREEAERAAAASASRRKRLGAALATVLAAAVAVIVVLAVASGDDEGANQTIGNIAIPPFEVTDVEDAVEAAGCRVQEFPSAGSQHTTEQVQYRTNPPTSGAHDPVPAEDGIYPAGGAPEVEKSVHSLEHGRINIQYRRGTPVETINRLERLVETFEVKGSEGYHALLFENQTNMPAAVAATAWTKSLTCPQMNDQVFDAIRAFWRANADKGPEFIP
jgi:hypothetical protein